MIKLNPMVAVWEYTLECDSNCLHCGSDAKYKRKNELSTTESLDLVEQLADLGIKLVVLSGGEPTLRQDWPDIAQRINQYGMMFGIISNALNWSTATVNTMTALNPYAVGFSVDGEPELHDYLRGVKGSHEKVFEMISALKLRNTTVCAITTVNNRNLKELQQIRSRLTRYGVDAWQIQMASPMGRMAENKDLVLNDKEYYQLGKFIIDTRAKLPSMNVQAGDCIGYFGKLEKGIRDGEWQGCMAGIEGLGIDSDGTIRACLCLRTSDAIGGNIRDKSLQEIWNDQDNFKFNRQFQTSDLKGKCVTCIDGAKCKGGCQSQSSAFFGEFHNAPYCFSRYEGENK